MRIVLVVLALLSVAACMPGPETSEEGSASARERGDATLAEAKSVVSTVLQAMGGTRGEARAGWQSCMAMPSYHYLVDGVLEAHAGPDALADVRTRLESDGYSDETQVDGRLTMLKDEMTFSMRKASPAYGEGKWRFSFATECGPLPEDDEEFAESDEGQDVEFTP